MMKWVGLPLALIACSVISPGRARANEPLRGTRGHFPHAELVQAYGRSIRTFNPKLSKSASEEAAEMVLNESERDELDARLLLAALKVDGTLDELHSTPDGLKARRLAAGQVIGTTGAALHRELLRYPGRTAKDTLRLALEAVRRRRKYGSADVRRYSRAVIALYVAQMPKAERGNSGWSDGRE